MNEITYIVGVLLFLGNIAAEKTVSQMISRGYEEFVDFIKTKTGKKPTGDEETLKNQFSSIDSKKISEIVEKASELMKLCRKEQKMVFVAPPPSTYELVGRTQLLKDAKQKIFSSHYVSLEGLPGAGKTAIALELINDPILLKQFRNGVLWITLGPKPDLRSNLNELRKALGVSSQVINGRKTIEDKMDVIRKSIRENHIFFVFDDVWETKTASSLKRILGKNCAALLTTRKPSVAVSFTGKGRRIKIPPLNRDSRLELLNQLAPQIVKERRKETQSLADLAGGLPLSLILIGRYLALPSESGQPHRIEQALKDLEDVRTRIETGTDDMESLSAVISISYRELDKDSSMMLQAITTFPPRPNTFSKEAAAYISGKPVKTLSTLTDCGLLEDGKKDRYMLHQGISDFAGLVLDKDRKYRNSIHERMVTFFVEYLKRDKLNYESLDLEYHNILAALQIASELDMNSSLVQGIITFYDFMENRGLYEKAESYLRQAKKTAKAAGDLNLSQFLCSYGRLVEKRGDRQKAIEYYLEGLEQANVIFGSKKVNSLIQDVWSFLQEKQVGRKKRTYRKKKNSGMKKKEDIQRLMSDLFRNLGVSLSKEGKDEEARKCNEIGLELIEDIRGQNIEVDRLKSDHFQGLGILESKWGNREKKRGNEEARKHYKRAEKYLREALLVAEEIGYKRRACGLYSSLGILEESLGNPEKAFEYYKKGLDIAQEAGYSTKISSFLVNIAQYHRFRGEYSQAEEYALDGLKLVCGMGYIERVRTFLGILTLLPVRHRFFHQESRYLLEGLNLPCLLNDPKQIERLVEILNQLRSSGKLKSNEEAFLEGLELALDIKNTQDIKILLRSLRFRKTRYKNREEEQRTLLDGKRISKERGNTWMECAIQSICGDFFLENEQYTEAGNMFRGSLRISRDHVFQELTAAALYGLARIAQKEDNTEEARQKGEESFEIFRQLNSENANEVEEWLNQIPQG